jgi:hypothetical protein
VMKKEDTNEARETSDSFKARQLHNVRAFILKEKGIEKIGGCTTAIHMHVAIQYKQQKKMRGEGGLLV